MELTQISNKYHSHWKKDIVILTLLAMMLGQSYCRLHKGTATCERINEKGNVDIEVCADDRTNDSATMDLPENYMTCFVHWDNSTGTPSNIKKGCWLNADKCKRRNECVAEIYRQTSYLLFCCCDGDLCNTNFSSVMVAEDEKTGHYAQLYDDDTQNEEDVIRRSGSHPVGHTVLFAVVPILTIVILTIAIFFICRRYRHPVGRGHTQLPTADPSCPILGGNGNGYSSGLIGSNQGVKKQALNVQFLELKAHGRYGTVWKAQMPGQFVAVKIFPQEDRQSWLAELEVYSLPQMKHDNILKFITYEEREEIESSKLWLVTEYHDNGSLCDYLKGHTITWAELCRIGETMACGLAYLHDEIPATSSQKGKSAVAHRDLKSKNVLLKSDLSACVADFGLALKFEPGKAASETHLQVGTRRYMAPEVLEGAICFNRDSFLRIDMYACGLILWELMSRCTAIDGPVGDYRLPFEAEVGQQPTLEDMHTVVVTHKIRPSINNQWFKHTGLNGLIPTVDECWDQDAEARLSAGCVQERIRMLSRTVNVSQQPMSELISDHEPPTQLQQQQQQQVMPQLPLHPHSLHQHDFVSGNNNINNNLMNQMSSASSPPPLPPMYVVPPSMTPAYTPTVIDVSRDLSNSGGDSRHRGSNC